MDIELRDYLDWPYWNFLCLPIQKFTIKSRACHLQGNMWREAWNSLDHFSLCYPIFCAKALPSSSWVGFTIKVRAKDQGVLQRAVYSSRIECALGYHVHRVNFLLKVQDWSFFAVSGIAHYNLLSLFQWGRHRTKQLLQAPNRIFSRMIFISGIDMFDIFVSRIVLHFVYCVCCYAMWVLDSSYIIFGLLRRQ